MSILRVAAGVILVPALCFARNSTFDLAYVDLTTHVGWVRAGDMNNDGALDIVAGGGYGLYVYENDGSAAEWTRYGNLDSTERMGANGGVLMDVDLDGDLDVISAQFYDDIGWWENPGGALSNRPWTFYKIGEVGQATPIQRARKALRVWYDRKSKGPHYYLHDITRTAFDHTGPSRQVVTPAISRSCGNVRISWFEPGEDPHQLWHQYDIEAGRKTENCNHAGIDVGDVNEDGRIDIAFSNGWYEAPVDPRAPEWQWHPVTNYDHISNTLLRDMNDDGRLDIVTSSGHFDGLHELRWYQNPGDAPVGSWPHTTIDSLQSPECLQVVDLDQDGDHDVVTCSMQFDKWDQEVHNVYVLENEREAMIWKRTIVAENRYASHKLQVVDVNGDGLLDIISESPGYTAISYYRNSGAPRSAAHTELGPGSPSLSP